MSVAIGAKHIFDILALACIPEIKHISFQEEIDSLILLTKLLFMFCLVLFAACLPSRHGPLNYDLEAYVAGKAPQGFPGWPFTQMRTAHTSVISKVQKQIDLLAASYGEQQGELSSASSVE